MSPRVHSVTFLLAHLTTGYGVVTRKGICVENLNREIGTHANAGNSKELVDQRNVEYHWSTAVLDEAIDVASGG